MQTVLPIEALTPEQAAHADQLANTIFPREDDGRLQHNDVDLDAGYEQLGQIVQQSGTARTVDYGIQRTTESSSGGLQFAGMPLLMVTHITVDETQQLTASELKVVDIEGTTRTMSPAPSCDLPSVNPATYPYDPASDHLIWDDENLRPRG